MSSLPLDVVAVLAVMATIGLLHGILWLMIRYASGKIPGALARLSGSRAWARLHPWRALLSARFPRLYRLLAARLEPGPFSGLPLTLIVLAALYLVALLGGLIEELREAEEMVRFDVAVSDLLEPLRSVRLVGLFAWVTDLGGIPALVAVSIVATGFLWADRRGHLVLPLWVTILGAEATTWFGKFGFARGRPDFITEVTAASPSFPSAHSSGAMAVYGFLAYCISRDLATPRQRFEVTYWTAVLILAIAGSRIFLGVHYASDVAAGLLVGGFWLLIGFALAEHLRPPTGGS